MPKTYKCPPLTEAVIALHFEQDEQWDWTIPGLLYGKIKDRFPQKSQEQTIQFEVSKNPSFPLIQGAPSKMKFTNEETHQLVQVAPNMLTYNALSGGYEGWDVFLRGFLDLVRDYAEVYPDAKISRIGLRYINDVKIPMEAGGAIDLNDHFQIGIRLPETLPDYTHLDLVTKTTLRFERDPPVLLKLTFGTTFTEPMEQHCGQFRLDLDAFTQHPPSLTMNASSDELSHWLGQAHEVVESTFQDAFTDSTHLEIFEAIE